MNTTPTTHAVNTPTTTPTTQPEQAWCYKCVKHRPNVGGMNVTDARSNKRWVCAECKKLVLAARKRARQ